MCQQINEMKSDISKKGNFHNTSTSVLPQLSQCPHFLTVAVHEGKYPKMNQTASQVDPLSILQYFLHFPTTTQIIQFLNSQSEVK